MSFVPPGDTEPDTPAPPSVLTGLILVTMAVGIVLTLARCA